MKLNVLVGCEESQAVCKEFRALGHEAYSCDLQECSGGHPEWHLQMDIFKAIDLKKWDLLIAFPPCTFIANAGQPHKAKDHTREKKTDEAIRFARAIYDCEIERVALENPVGVMSTRWRRPDQAIQPFYFGDPIRKYTCLWLKNLPPLAWVKKDDLFNQSLLVKPNPPIGEFVRKGKYRPGTIRKLYWQDYVPKKDRGKIKSKTFPGIAKAMADQWSEYIINKETKAA